MMTHCGKSFDRFVFCNTISEVIDNARVSTANTIVVDEVQFFFGVSDDELIGLQRLALTKLVVVAGLDTSFKFVPFETTAKMMAIADKVLKLTAACACGSPASLTTLKSTETKPLTTYLPGSEERYEPVCKLCAFAEK